MSHLRALFAQKPFLSANANLLLFTLSSGMLMPFLAAVLQRYRGLGSLEITVLTTVFIVGSKGAQIACGPLIDAVDKRWAMIGANAASGLLILAWGALDQFWPLLGVTVGAALASAVNILAVKSLVAQAGAQRGQGPLAFAVLNLVVNLSSAVGAVAAGLLWDREGGRVLFTVAALLPLLGAVAVFCLPWSPAPAADKRPALGFFANFRSVAGDRRFLKALPFFAAGFFMYAQFFTTLPFFLCGLGGEAGQGVGLVFLVNSLMIIALQLPVGRWHSLMQERAPGLALYLIFACFAGAFLVVGASQALGALVIAAVCFTAGEMLFTPYVDSLTAGFASEANRATYFSVASAARALGDGLGGGVGIFCAAEAARRGAAPRIWLGMAALAVLLCLGLAWLSRAGQGAGDPAVQEGASLLDQD